MHLIYFKCKQADELRLILVTCIRFDNEPLERISDNRDERSCCESAFLLLHVCSVLTRAVKSLLGSSVSLCEDLYSVYSQHNPGKCCVPRSIIQRHRGTSEQRRFQCSQLLNMLLIYLTFFS